MGPLSSLESAVIAQRVFSPVLMSVGEARALVVEAVAGSAVDMVDSARLLTSELVTNAVVHTGTDVEVTVRRLASGVRVEVADHESQPPVPTSVPALSVRGRGLDLVATMADGWGFKCWNGKVVWFDLKNPDLPDVRLAISALTIERVERMQDAVREDRSALANKRWCKRHS
jgi:hypothetical protein